LHSDRDSRLTEDRFISLINPSFGYPISEEYIIGYILGYDDFDILSTHKSLKQGTHRIKVTASGENEITIRSGDQNSQTVLTG
jgi:hypothetical protein